MRKIIGRLEPQTYALFRIVFGFLFATHGAQKLFGWPGAASVPPAAILKIAGCIELTCGLLILVGLFASLAAFIASGQMAVAYFTAHAPGGFWPILNKGELAVLYCFAFLYIAARGAGIWSAESRRPGGRRK